MAGPPREALPEKKAPRKFGVNLQCLSWLSKMTGECFAHAGVRAVNLK